MEYSPEENIPEVTKQSPLKEDTNVEDNARSIVDVATEQRASEFGDDIDNHPCFQG